MPQILIHATALEKDGAAVLLSGASRYGKSDLALRLMDRGFRLISDDQTAIFTDADGHLMAGAAPNIQGMMELRGIGVISLAHDEWHAGPFPVTMEIELVARDDVERMPEQLYARHLDIEIPIFQLHAFDMSVVLKIERLLKHPEIVTGHL